MIDTVDDDAGPERLAEQEALRRLVADVSDGLSEGDRAMLRLHLHGLDGAELAAALGISASIAHVRLSRLRDQVERSLGALLVARLGRRDCDDLAAVLGEWDGRFTPLLRKRVARHVDNCSRCGERRRVVAGPRALLSGVVLLPAPLELRERVLGDVRLVAHGSSEPGSVDSGPDPSAEAGSGAAAVLAQLGRSRMACGVVAALVVAVLAGGAVMFWGARPVAFTEVPAVPLAPFTSGPVPASPGRPGTVPDAPRPGPTPSGPTNSAGAPPITGAPPTIGIDPPRATTPVPGSTVPPGPAPTPLPDSPAPTPDPTPDPILPPRIIDQKVSPPVLGPVGCVYPSAKQAAVSVTVADDVPATVAVLSWSGAAGSGSMPMLGSGTTWSGSLGPFPGPDEVRWSVTVSNAAGPTNGPEETITVSCVL